MNRYDKGILKFDIFLFILAIINLAWGIAKTILIDWNPLMFSRAGIMVYGAFFVAGIFLYISLKDIINYIKYKKIEHDLDERTAKILTKSFVNAALFLILGLYANSIYIELFYINSLRDLTLPLISPLTIGLIFGLGSLIFFISLLYYKNKKL